MGWPQIVMMITIGANVGIALVKNGEEKDERYNFAITVIASLIEVAILRAGGFW